MLRKRNGYTLIEMLVSISVMVFIAVMAVYGLSNFRSSQPVVNAQQEFITGFRGLQNLVTQGVGGLNNRYVVIDNNTSLYTFYDNSGNITGTTTLPLTVIITLPVINTKQTQKLVICVPNPNLTFYTNTAGSSYCGPCGSGVYFGCYTSDLSTYTKLGLGISENISVCFTNGTSCSSGYSKSVVIEGNGLFINRITTP